MRCVSCAARIVGDDPIDCILGYIIDFLGIIDDLGVSDETELADEVGE